MVKTIRIDGIENYFLDPNTNEKVIKWDPSRELSIVLNYDNSSLTANSDQIFMKYGNQLEVQYMGDKLIIDDGYQNTLVKCGYIVYKDYDEHGKSINNKEEGIELRNKVINDTRSAIIKSINNSDVESDITMGNDKILININIKDFKYKYTIVIDTVDNIVTKNMQRKDNSLPFYPFLKDVDKYAAMYVSIFAEKQERYNINGGKFIFPNKIIEYALKELQEYHFLNLNIKRRLIYCKDI